MPWVGRGSAVHNEVRLLALRPARYRPRPVGGAGPVMMPGSRSERGRREEALELPGQLLAGDRVVGDFTPAVAYAALDLDAHREMCRGRGHQEPPELERGATV